ncbi:hypothetical protein IMG5_006880 [Ichthyophthirius multifiliis]|uniref:Transmembrane protein n=1 Tax=Ichthyophthirius multifiliis TaxID=5932 RepID=G0QJN3_ICHMU|nr:hypothetical protein IMG5_006880 [Ichthyophthirius multifiliis]EGR34570.1 hypothetical protein IMG5_006880 [Ichthyophthirius multifiliis]|eukprot:XP_004039874.1 hypothetical protein IMG5_006880 [Ichthyophthirius multifiliis]
MKKRIYSLLIFQPNQVSPNVFKMGVDLQTMFFCIPFDVQKSKYGNYIIFKDLNQFLFKQINSDTTLNLDVFSKQDNFDFNITLYTTSNYTQNSIIRHLNVKMDIQQYKVLSFEVDNQWIFIGQNNRFAYIEIPQKSFQGPIQSIHLLQQQIYQKNDFYVKVRQMSLQSKLIQQNNYNNVQFLYGINIDAAFFQKQNLFIFLTQKQLIFVMPNMKTHSFKINFLLGIDQDFDFSKCSIFHHKNCPIAYIHCKQFQKIQEISYKVVPNTFEIVNFSQKNIYNLPTQQFGDIQQIILNDDIDCENIENKFFMLSKYDSYYQESFISYASTQGNNIKIQLRIDAKTMGMRFLIVQNISVKSFFLEGKIQFNLIGIIQENQVIFLRINQQNQILQKIYEQKNKQKIQTIDLFNIDQQKDDILIIKYILQYINSDSVLLQTKINIQNTNNTITFLNKKKVLAIYKHYKMCSYYVNNPILYFENQNKHFPQYLARFCVFQQKSLGEYEADFSYSYQLVLYSYSNNYNYYAQSIIQLPYFNRKPSRVFFYKKIQEEQEEEDKINILITSYINLFVDYYLYKEYKLEFYFKKPQKFVISKKNIDIYAVNNHFSNTTKINYYLIDYQADIKQQKSIFIYFYFTLCFFMALFYFIPIFAWIFNNYSEQKQRKKTEKEKKNNTKCNKKNKIRKKSKLQIDQQKEEDKEKQKETIQNR